MLFKKNNLINKVFQYFNAPEIQDPNNLERFKKLREKIKSDGDNEFLNISEDLAVGHKQIFNF